MSRQKRLVVFDFDGTITRGDTLIGFLRSTHGVCFYLWFALLLVVLIPYKIGMIKNDKAKQIVFRCFYRGWSIDRFNAACVDYVSTIRTRPMAMTALLKHLSDGESVVIVSASPENWVRIWAQANGIETVLSTRLEVDINGRITGRFLTPNCYGAEKVNRLCEVFPELVYNRNAVYLVAYGDSRGDRELLTFADKAYFKTF